MLRQSFYCGLRLVPTPMTAVPVRTKKSKNKRTRPVLPHMRTVPSKGIAWSTGEVIHPAPPDTPLGDKVHSPIKLPDGGIKYFGFTYYPRFPDQADPPCIPAPLHLVTRTRSLQGKPWWTRDVMKTLGLDGKRSDVCILKNNPENNAHLWEVKHMVKITPIRIPENLPKDADPKCCFIKENGEFIYSPFISVPDSLLTEDEQLTKLKWNGGFTDKDARRKWDYPWQIKL